jgi:hypothetical protein
MFVFIHAIIINNSITIIIIAEAHLYSIVPQYYVPVCDCIECKAEYDIRIFQSQVTLYTKKHKLFH